MNLSILFFTSFSPASTAGQHVLSHLLLCCCRCCHCRPAARRLQNMGWTPNNQIWLSTRGGEVLINNKSGIEEEDYKSAQLNSRGFGILDVG
jgi:hypothetical protein